MDLLELRERQSGRQELGFSSFELAVDLVVGLFPTGGFG